jgi:hypothetical protein
MSCQNLTFNYYNNANSTKLYIITHGMSDGIESSLLQKIRTKLIDQKSSFVFIQFPFRDRGDSSSSGELLPEEIQAVEQISDFIGASNYKDIHFIGKSIGGIVLADYIKKHYSEFSFDFKLTVLGYLAGDIVLDNENPYNIHIIQGTNDKYTSKELLLSTLASTPAFETVIDYVQGADHSYRNENKEPVFEDTALGYIQF